MRIERTFRLGAHDVRIEAGEMARHATAAVLLDMQGTVVLATVVAARQPKPGQSFFPLSVDYSEETSPAGQIPDGRDRRNGIATECEALVSCLIDRSIRPLFPRGFNNEVHVAVHVKSVNPAFPPDVPALPEPNELPYVIRVGLEVTESSASLSMASVCGGCLAMVDAGVPLKGLAAGVALGLIVEGERFAVLTDIVDDEDAISDMALKVAGTDHGITALQLAVKIPGIDLVILEAALAQAQDARHHILDAMRSALGVEEQRGLPANALAC